MSRAWILLVGALAVALAIAYAATGSDEVSRTPPSACGAVGLEPGELGANRTRALTLCLLNEQRGRRGLAPLRLDKRLELASQRHSRDMVERRYFEHDTPEGIDPQQRMLAAGYPSNNAFTGENIAWSAGTGASPGQIVERWMNSPPHREDILRPQFVEVGVGVAPGAPEPQRTNEPPFTYTTDFGGPPVR